MKIDSAAFTRGQGKLSLYIPWLPVEAALSIFDVRFSFNKKIFERELIKTKEIVINAES